MGNDENEKNPQMTRMDTDRCPQADNGWRCIVSTDVMFYPQMSDRCYTDFHLFQICITSVDCIGPHADGDVFSNCYE